MALDVFKRFTMFQKNSFREFRLSLLSSLFEVKTSTVPWGLYVVGEAVKLINAFTRRKDGTIHRRVSDFLEIKVGPEAKAIDGISSKDVVIDEKGNVWVRVFVPSDYTDRSDEKPAKDLPVVVYFHGGGFGVLSADFIVYDRFCRAISRACNAVVVSVNYRRAPEHRYPRAYEDCFKALEWLQSSDSDPHLPRRADISQCFLAGDSAGGNIVHFVGCQAAQADLSPLEVRGMIMLQPFFGSEERTPAELTLVNVPIISTDATDWYWKAFLPDGADRDHAHSNVFGPNARDISGLSLPPILVVISSLDVLKDHQTRYASRIQQMGIAKWVTVKHYQGGVHGFYFFENLKIKLALECLDDVTEFIRRCCD